MIDLKCQIRRREDLDEPATETRKYPLRWWECAACDRRFTEPHPTIGPGCQIGNQEPMNPGDACIIEYPEGHELKGNVLDGLPAVVVLPLDWAEDGDEAYVVTFNVLRSPGEATPRLGLIRSDALVRRWADGDPWHMTPEEARR